MKDKIIKRTIQIISIVVLALFLFNSCQDSNPLATQPELRLMEQHTMNPGELPQPMIVGGYPVDPACPN